MSYLWWLVSVSLTVVLLVVVLLSRHKKRAASGAKIHSLDLKNIPIEIAPEPLVTLPVQAGSMSRELIAQRLAVLAEISPAPVEVLSAMCYSVAAMCYDMEPRPVEYAPVVYLCPSCGDRTLYHDYYGQKLLPLPNMRRLTREIARNKQVNLGIFLDESAFCEKCRTAGDEPQVSLVVRYPDSDQVHRTSNITQEDLELVLRFVNHPIAGEQLLSRENLDRLRQLLGIEPKLL